MINVTLQLASTGHSYTHSTQQTPNIDPSVSIQNESDKTGIIKEEKSQIQEMIHLNASAMSLV